MGRKDGKPRGRTTAYAYFIQTCREEHKKKHPDEQVVFAEFSRKCAEKWKGMNPKEKKRFEDMAAKDKTRYEAEMANYSPPKGGKADKKRKRKKDPNAPKRALSAFFFFCGEERPSVKEENPSYSIGDVAKELGRRWEKCTNKAKYEALAKADKARYEKELAIYKGGGGSKKVKVEKKKPIPVEEDDDDEEEDDDDDEEDDDDDEEEDDDDDDE